MPASAKLAAALPPSVKFSQRGAVGFVALARAEKRNALNVETVEGLHHCFLNLPASVKAVVEAATAMLVPRCQISMPPLISELTPGNSDPPTIWNCVPS